MQRLNTSPIGTGNGFPMKKGTLEFLQDSPKIALQEFIFGFIGSNPGLTIYKVYGCDITDLGGGNYSISSGQLFYNGDLYAVSSQFFTIDPGAGPALGVNMRVAITGQYTFDADPVQFTGAGAPVNVHDIYGIIVETATTPSGDSIFFSLSAPPNFETIFHSPLITPVYSGTYMDHGSTPIRYRKSFNKIVKLRGRVANSVSAAIIVNSPIFTLPSGFRPTTDKYFMCVDLATTSKISWVEVASTGVVSIRADFGGSSNTGVVLDSVSFDID